MRALLFVFFLGVCLGCAKPPVGAPAHFSQQGTETHGGDILVAQAKTLAYRILGEDEATESIRDEIAARPAFSEKVISSERLIKRSFPRRHWVLNRIHFESENSNKTSELRSVALQMIAEASAATGSRFSPRAGVLTSVHGLSFEEFQGDIASLLFDQAADDAIVRFDQCLKYRGIQPRLSDAGWFKQTEITSRLNQLQNLIGRIPLVSYNFPLFDPEFGYELDAQATVSGGRREIRVNVSRISGSRLTTESLQLLALHEYSHFMDLSERDHHYLYTYFATSCL